MDGWTDVWMDGMGLFGLDWIGIGEMEWMNWMDESGTETRPNDERKRTCQLE